MFPSEIGIDWRGIQNLQASHACKPRRKLSLEAGWLKVIATGPLTRFGGLKVVGGCDLPGKDDEK